MDKDQTFVGLSSEDEELLNQKLPEVSATSRTEQEAEKKVLYLEKLIGPLQDLLAIKIIMVKYTKKKIAVAFINRAVGQQTIPSSLQMK